jgi:hypothetical protein
MGEGEKRGTGGGGAHFKGGRWCGAEEGVAWGGATQRGGGGGAWRGGGQHGSRAARSAGNGPRSVGAGGVVRPCLVAGLNRGGRWLTGGPSHSKGVAGFKSDPKSNLNSTVQNDSNISKL